MWDFARKATIVLVRFFSVAASGSDANITLKQGRRNQGSEIPDRCKQIIKKKNTFVHELQSGAQKRNIVYIALWVCVGFHNSHAHY